MMESASVCVVARLLAQHKAVWPSINAQQNTAVIDGQGAVSDGLAGYLSYRAASGWYWNCSHFKAASLPLVRLRDIQRMLLASWDKLLHVYCSGAIGTGRGTG